MKNFEKEFGCRVVARLLRILGDPPGEARGQAVSGFDVVFPSDEVMRAFIAKGLVEKIDPAKVPNSEELSPRSSAA